MTRVAQLRADRVVRAEYEARLAQRHYQAVDPDNRLVAAELERRWEVALQAVVEAREELERMASHPQIPELTAEMKAHLQDVGRHLPDLWASGRLTPAQQKEVLRSLIRRVIVTRPTPDTIEARVVWVSGATTSFSVHPPILRGADVSGYERLVERILALGGAGIPGPRNRSPGDSRGLSFCSQCTHSCLAGRGDPTSTRTNRASPSSSRPKPRSRENGL